MNNEGKLKLTRAVSTMRGEAAYEVLAKAEKLERAGKKIIHLEIGQPDFPTPQHIADAGIRAILQWETKYAPTLGVWKLREAIANDASRRYGFPISPEMVAVTPSAKTAIALSMIALLEPGDEVIYPDPGFPTYENMTRFLGCVPKPVPLLEDNDFSFDLAALRNLVSPKTKLIILNSPSNPTGGIIPQKDLLAIKEIAEEVNCFVMSDEIYFRMAYDSLTCPSIYSLPCMKERTFVVDGFSKIYSMTGWRLGYIILPSEYAKAIDTLMVNTFASTATFTQYAGIEALTSSQEESIKMVKEFEERRNLIVELLNDIPGMHCKKPRGAFYVFPNVKKFGMPSQKLADLILEQAGVALLPGTAFGQYGEGYLRISYATARENIKTGAQHIKNFLASLKQ